MKYDVNMVSIFQALLYSSSSTMIGRNILQLASRRSSFASVRGVRGLPEYNSAAGVSPGAALGMLSVFMGFWGLAFVVNPFQDRHVADKTFEAKWQK